MTDQPFPDGTQPDPGGAKPAPRKDLSVAPDASPVVEGADSDQATADEQMARYEDYLKEKDWGHQPC